jgi:transposase
MGAHIAFIDESGFQLTPSVRRTWAPRGQTPVVRHWQRRDKVSATSAITVSPKRTRIGLYWQLHLTNIRQADACAFLRHLLRHLRGHVVVIWDNGNTHKGEPIRELRRRFPRLHLEHLPPYAPELNPDEGVWDHLKDALANGCPDDVGELLGDLTGALGELKDAQSTLRSCIHRSGLPRLLPYEMY